MKKLILLLILNIVIGFAQNVKVSDYELAVSKAMILRLNGYWNWAQSGDSVTADVANAKVFFRTFYSSLPFAWFIDFDLNGSKTRDVYGYETKTKIKGQKYIFEDKDLFAFAQLDAYHSVATNKSVNNQIETGLAIGAGYGRYIEATALAKAVRIEEHLIREKIIADNLPKVTMIKIANIIERESEYIDIYKDIYETFWISDIEKEIKASGLLKGENIGAIGILRIRQVLFRINEIVNERFYGWDVSAGSRFDLTTKDGSRPGSPRLYLSGRYSYPISWKMQINTALSILTPLDSIFFKKYDLLYEADFIYEFSNRINFVTTYAFSLNKVYDSNPISQHSLGLSFLFYLENKIILGINGAVNQTENKPRIVSFNISIQYNFF